MQDIPNEQKLQFRRRTGDAMEIATSEFLFLQQLLQHALR
jgi:hypothetical protein